MTNLSYHLLAGKCNLLFYFLSFSISYNIFSFTGSFSLSLSLSLSHMDTAIFPFYFVNPFVWMRHRVFCISSVIFVLNGYCLAFEPYYLLFEKGINNFITILLSKCLYELLYVLCSRCWCALDGYATKYGWDKKMTKMQTTTTAMMTSVVALGKNIEKEKEKKAHKCVCVCASLVSQSLSLSRSHFLYACLFIVCYFFFILLIIPLYFCSFHSRANE